MRLFALAQGLLGVEAGFGFVGRGGRAGGGGKGLFVLALGLLRVEGFFSRLLSFLFDACY